MRRKRLLILTGYDYSESFMALEDMDYQVVVPANEPMLSDVAYANLRSAVADKLAEIKYQDIQAHLQEVRPDILITFGWRRLVPAEIINSAKIAVNIHPALLPAYRGYHPVPHVLINREKEHGITAHMITSKMDDGEIVSQMRFAIDRFSTLNQIQNRVNELMPAFLRQLCEKLSCGEFKLTKNEESKTKVVAGKRTPKDSEIPLSMTMGKAYDFIRACDENRFPAYILIEGRKVEIRMKLVEKNKS